MSDENKEPKLEKFRPLAMLSQIALTIMSPIFLCLFVGKWLDEKFTQNNTITLIAILLGILTSYRNAYVLLRGYMKNNNKKDEGNNDEKK